MTGQVTMEWWTHLWLNEGFATWIEYLCVDHTHPEYEIWTNFLSREYASAMNLDALASSHPIEVCLYLEIHTDCLGITFSVMLMKFDLL